MRLQWLLAAIFGTAALTAGCGNKEAPLEGRLDPYEPAQVHFSNTNLRERTRVGTPQLARDEAGLLHVTVPIRSTTNLQLYVDYRVTFLDETGTPIQQSGPFTTTLKPYTPQTIRVNSTSPRAADFQIDFDYAR